MQTPPSETPAERTAKYVAAGIALLVIAWFYGFVPGFSGDRSHSPLMWLMGSWNGETDYEHGPLYPFIIVGMICWQWRHLKAAASQGEWRGLWLLALGALGFLIAHRTHQARAAVAALPLVLLGGAWFLWGRQVAKLLAFPLLFFWLAVPMPSFQQATTHLQLIATKLAHYGSMLCGVKTTVEGTTVLPVTGNWKPLDIATGCSGIRSLMALLMISAAWAYVAKLPLWKKFILFFAAFPIAVIGNALRVISIFVIAQYGNAEFASGAWHDWSGLLLFYPISLALLLALHTLLEGGLPWKSKRRRRVVVRTQSSNATAAHE